MVLLNIARVVKLISGLLVLLLFAAILVRLPGFLRPQEPGFAIVQQARRYVDADAFARGLESRELVNLHEFATLAAEVYDADPLLTKQLESFGWRRCLACAQAEGSPADALALRTWIKNRTGQPPIAVIAFRGTRFEDLDDWNANLRWVTRLVPGRKDHYDKVQAITPTLVRLIDQEAAGRIEIAAVGHSLGGGLAQQAGYVSARIERVYAFDPSPVTGYYDIDGATRIQNSLGKRIYRIYEHGEILAYARLLLKAFYPVADRDPEIVELRFNLTEGSSVSQHSMAELARALTRLAQESTERPGIATGDSR